MVEISHHLALVTVVLPWNGTTYLPEAEAQRATDRRRQRQNEISNNTADSEHREDLLHDLEHPKPSIIDHPGLGKLQGNIQRGLGNLVMLRQKAAWMMHIMKS